MRKITLTKHSFSLIEMLVVFLIIIMLLSFLLPTLKGMRKKTDELKCRSNLQQIGVLTLLYSADNNGSLPNYKNDEVFGKVANQTGGWHGHLATYIVKLDNWNASGSYPLFNNSFIRDVDGLYNSNPNDDYYDILKSSVRGEKGWGGLQVFICPSAADFSDPGGMIQFPEFDLKRVLSVGASEGRLPSSYTSNAELYGHEYWDVEHVNLNDMRDKENQVLLIEGNSPTESGVSASSLFYQKFSLRFGVERHKFTKSFTTWSYIGLNSFVPTFLHDDIEEFWASSSTFTWGMKDMICMEFNEIMQGDAVAGPVSYGTWGTYILISYKDPFGANMDKIQASGFSSKPTSYTYFYEPEFQSMTGNMNVLFGDMHVDKKSDGWLATEKSSSIPK